jgi:hypothetical protein
MLDWLDGVADRWAAEGRSMWSLSMVWWAIVGEFAGVVTYILALATGQSVGVPWWLTAAAYLLGLPCFFLLLGVVVWRAVARIDGVD